MRERLKYHFEPKKGWMNDPNGLIYFKGKYHAFFQHNPFATHWSTMHWGHAVSNDLVNWEELPIALYPDKSYENSDGCFSGSAIVKDDILYLFYTSVSKELGQTQSIAISKDGITFEKYEGNPVIREFPIEGSRDFRDPKVTKINDAYYMVCGSGKDGIGKILLYKSLDLFNWQYVGVFLEGAEYGEILECPDFFPFEDKYLLLFSQIGRKTHSTMFIYGDFDGTKFTPISFHTPEVGPSFYAPQTFLDNQNRRIIIGWLYHWHQELDEGEDSAGALTIPCEIKMIDGKLCIYPVQEARHLLKETDEIVVRSEKGMEIITQNNAFPFPLQYEGNINHISILKDTKTIEVFINDGEAVYTYWCAK